MLRTVFLMLLIAAWFCNASLEAAQTQLLASSFSDRYHLDSCKVAKKIRKEDKVFFKTPEEAIEAGLNPCKKCNPPSSSVISD